MMKNILIFVLLAGLIIPVGTTLQAAQPNLAPWPSINTSLVAGGLDNPVHITHAGDGSGRLFVVE